MNLVIHERPGRCRWCGCTYNDPCVGGCGWANRAETLCTSCVEFDRAVRTVNGRQELVETYNLGAEMMRR